MYVCVCVCLCVCVSTCLVLLLTCPDAVPTASVRGFLYFKAETAGTQPSLVSLEDRKYSVCNEWCHVKCTAFLLLNGREWKERGREREMERDRERKREIQTDDKLMRQTDIENSSSSSSFKKPIQNKHIHVHVYTYVHAPIAEGSSRESQWHFTNSSVRARIPTLHPSLHNPAGERENFVSLSFWGKWSEMKHVLTCTYLPLQCQLSVAGAQGLSHTHCMHWDGGREGREGGRESTALKNLPTLATLGGNSLCISYQWSQVASLFQVKSVDFRTERTTTWAQVQQRK